MCVHVCVWVGGWVGACAVCKVMCGNSVNGVTPEKRTSERHNFTSTLAIEMYLIRQTYMSHITYNTYTHIYGIRAIRLSGMLLTVYVVSKEMSTQARKVGT